MQPVRKGGGPAPENAGGPGATRADVRRGPAPPLALRRRVLQVGCQTRPRTRRNAVQQLPIPQSKDIVFIGGGHAHALVLRKWGMAPLPGARLTVIDPNPVAPYTGMLPGHVAGHYPRAALEIDLAPLARFAGARLVIGRATGIDLNARRVRVEGRPDIAYDRLSIDIGITSAMPEIAGFTDHAVAAKPLGPFARKWRGYLAAVARGERPAEAVVIGGGVAGVELSLAMMHALRARAGTAARVTVLEADQDALSNLNPATRRVLLRHLERAGVTLLTGVEVTEVASDHVRMRGGTSVATAMTVGAAGARPHRWLAETGLALENGFVKVGRDLSSPGDRAVFAVGDCAHLTYAPRPKAGVFAVRQAPVLYHNLRADLTGGARRAYRPQRDYLKLISLGGKSALADKSGLRSGGALMWRWKDRIDRAFMSKFHDLPEMAAPKLPPLIVTESREILAGHPPLCGGCGAKVGSDVLSDILADLPGPGRPDVLSGPGDDAAILKSGDGFQVLTTDHLRGFLLDPYVMARIAAVHALGDIWAMGAAPQAALLQLTLPPLSLRLQRRTLAEVTQAVGEVLTQEGAALVGGHTAQGAELSIGLSLSGLSDRPPLTHAGARAGDAIVLTKALGSGLILAAEMQGLAAGSDLAHALGVMMRPQGDAAAILRDARAMTDVTGFGLAGHLQSILRASGAGTCIDLGALPVLPGAIALLERDLRASLHDQNRQVWADTVLPEDPRAELLFDPQTGGGLLAVVPRDQVRSVLTRLTDAGHTAALIGDITKEPGIRFR